MHTITKTFEWSMAHRLIHGYEGKCKNLHGHTYKAEITIEGPIDPKLFGMVCDFGVVSEILKEWVMSNLDHAVLVDSEDSLLLNWLVSNNQKHFKLPDYVMNSTAENISCLLAHIWDKEMRLRRQLGAATWTIQEVKVWETPTSCATWNRWA